MMLSVKMARRRIMMNYWPLVREHRRPVVYTRIGVVKGI